MSPSRDERGVLARFERAQAVSDARELRGVQREALERFALRKPKATAWAAA